MYSFPDSNEPVFIKLISETFFCSVEVCFKDYLLEVRIFLL